MAWTQTDLDAIDAAIASGELTVSVNGRLVTYRSIAELLRARAAMLASIQSTSTRSLSPRYRRATFRDCG
jgi:roadblock/LC7 domain-containing protein